MTNSNVGGMENLIKWRLVVAEWVKRKHVEVYLYLTEVIRARAFQSILGEDKTEKERGTVNIVGSLMTWNTWCSDTQDGVVTGTLVGQQLAFKQQTHW